MYGDSGRARLSLKFSGRQACGTGRRSLGHTASLSRLFHHMSNNSAAIETRGHEEWRAALYDNYQPNRRADDFRSRYPYLKLVINRNCPTDRDARILDLGCGNGTFLMAISKCGYRNLTGVDISPSQIEIARARGVGSVLCGSGLSFLEESSPSQYELVISFDVIEHLTRQELYSFGRAVQRVLVPGGRWLIHVPNAAGLFGNRIRYADATHEQAFTPESIGQWAAVLGFSRVRCFEDKPVVHGINSLLRRVGWAIIRTVAATCLIVEGGPTKNLILSQNLLAVMSK